MAVALADKDGALEVSDFLRKPFSWEKLRATVARWIGGDVGDDRRKA